MRHIYLLIKIIIDVRLKKYFVPTGLFIDLNLLSTNILSLRDSPVRGYMGK